MDGDAFVSLGKRTYAERQKRSCVKLAQLESIYVEYSCDNRILKSVFFFFRRPRPWSILVCSTFLQDGVVLEVLLRINSCAMGGLCEM